MAWIRARQPQQKEKRRQAVLAAASDMFSTLPYDKVSMSNIARLVGMSASSLYTYFDSKEELFLTLYQQELNDWLAAVEAEDMTLQLQDEEAAEYLAGMFAERPRLAGLTAILAGVLEQNTADRPLRDFKVKLCAFLQRITEALSFRVEAIGPGDWKVLLHINAIIAGLWPMAHPPERVTRIIDAEGLDPLRIEFFSTLKEMLTIYLRGHRAGSHK